jgi:hypothetical protein
MVVPGSGGLPDSITADRHPRRPFGRSLRKPLDTADKRISRVLSAEALGPQPSADFGPYDAFVERA